MKAVWGYSLTWVRVLEGLAVQGCKAGPELIRSFGRRGGIAGSTPEP